MILLLILTAISASYARVDRGTSSLTGPTRGTSKYTIVSIKEGSGSRFLKTVGTQEALNGKTEHSTCIELDTNRKFQTMKGFGGAVSDSASINWKNMSEVLQQKLIDTYFGNDGIGYSFIRVPIGGSDFSTHTYAYNELPVNDAKLSNFSLSYEDHQYKIPMIKAARKASSTDVWVLATTWSPPLWMKTNNTWYGASRLKDEYFQTYADYHVKFIENYHAEGVPVWGITTTNEPFDGVFALAPINSLGFDPVSMANFIADHLGPTIRRSKFNNTQILAVDDQRFAIPIWFSWVLVVRPDALNFIDGVAVHMYGNFITPASVLDIVTANHSQKFLLATEASAGSSTSSETGVKLGSWSRARQYILDIIEDINHGVTGWLDWNMCLNTLGGPSWSGNYVDSPIIISDDQKEFWKQPMFYAMGHFAKFVPRGSQRIAIKTTGDELYCNAFVTPNNTVVAVIYNDHDQAKTVRFQLKNKQAIFKVPKGSITTIELSH